MSGSASFATILFQHVKDLLDEHRNEHEGDENDVRTHIKEDSQPVKLLRFGLSGSSHESDNNASEVHRADEWHAEERDKADDVSTARVSIGRDGSNSQPRTQYRETNEDPPDNTQDDRRPGSPSERQAPGARAHSPAQIPEVPSNTPAPQAARAARELRTAPQAAVDTAYSLTSSVSFTLFTCNGHPKTSAAPTV